MWDERNAEDTRLLAAGDHATLLATYYEIILGRCLARLRNEADAYEVAHRVIERLIGELSRGRTYTVAVQRGRQQGRRLEGGRVLQRRARVDAAGGLGRRRPRRSRTASSSRTSTSRRLFAPLPERTRQVLELYYRRGLEAEEIGKTLGMARNAVYQRLHQGHAKLREAFRDAG